jgi:hypothetical protein
VLSLQHGKSAAKKWKWQTPDHAGTREVGIGGEGVKRTLEGFARAFMKGAPLKPTGSWAEYARVTGRKVIFKAEDGTLFDEQGNIVEAPKGAIFVPLKNTTVVQ